MKHFQWIRLSGRDGFTLLELLVVVAVVGFLSSIAIVALSVSQSHSRDTQRLLDQATILKGVELYKSDTGAVPAQLKSASLRVPIAYQSVEPLFNRILSVSSVQAVGIGGHGGPGGGCPSGYEGVPPDCRLIIVGGGGGGGATCGDDSCDVDAGEDFASCPSDCHCGNNVCEPSWSETVSSCASDCYCGNNLCDSGETIASCAADCNSGGSGGGALLYCGNGSCESGETPGNCSQDCPNYAMCYVSGEWDLCCLFGGNYCSQSGGRTDTGGYYGVCNGSRCESRYLLQRPAFSCSDDSECSPTAETETQKFVPDKASNWLQGMEQYIVVPKDPGGTNPAQYQVYYASSHPDIVKGHEFCVYIAFEGKDRLWPYTDLIETPTHTENGGYDEKWSVLCLQ